MIQNRIKDTEHKKNKSYNGMDFNLPREEFIQWFMENDFEGCSVDRIDNSRGYSMENIQLISISKNIAKDKLLVKNGLRLCTKCMEYKEFSECVVDKRISVGVRSLCKKCEKILLQKKKRKRRKK